MQRIKNSGYIAALWLLFGGPAYAGLQNIVLMDFEGGPLSIEKPAFAHSLRCSNNANYSLGHRCWCDGYNEPPRNAKGGIDVAALAKSPGQCFDLSGADLRGALLSGSVSLIGAKLNEARLDGARLIGADLSWATMSGGSLQGAFMEKAILVEAILVTNLSDAHLEMADLRGATVGGSMRDAVLTGAKLEKAVLDVSGRDWPNMSGLDLRGADIRAHYLPLCGADLREARLSIDHADMAGSDLRGAQIQVLDLESCKLEGAQYDDHTQVTHVYGMRADELAGLRKIFETMAKKPDVALPDSPKPQETGKFAPPTWENRL